MTNNKFYKLGQVVYKCRWYIIALWFILIMSCIPLIPNIISPFKTTGFVDETSQSTKTEKYLNKKFGYDSYNKFIIMYTSKTLKANDPLFINKIKKSLSRLNTFPIKHEIIYPNNNKQQISKDKHTAYAVVIIKLNQHISDTLLTQFKNSIKSPAHMTMALGGEPVFVDNINKQTEKDLYKADFIATPVAIITMLIVFGSLISAILPIILGGGCALIILSILYFLGHLFTLSIFTLNIALLLGLCLSLDYSLFVISRFRDELKIQSSIIEAISITQATAGRAVFFSSIAVFTSLSALFLFPINILFSVAVGGLTAVFIAMMTAMMFLPAILSVLKENINRIPVRFFNKKKETSFNWWYWLTNKVIRRPLLFFIIILTFLLMLGYPFLSARFGISDFHIFPEHSEYRTFFKVYSKNFNEKDLTPIIMSVRTPHEKILSKNNISNLYDLTRQLKNNSLIEKVNSIVTTSPQLTKDEYYRLYNMPKNVMDAHIKQLLETTTRHHLTVINITSKYPINSEKTQLLIKELRNLKVGHGMTIELTGTPVSNMDVLHKISQKLPLALLWIMGFTYLILLILLRSLFLPIKAILMNLLSLSACFGALVLVFQDGYFHQLLMFDPQHMLDISLLVIIFCALFGFSMDYEVFLLTRIKESYLQLHDNDKSIVYGIEKSCRIITSAAIIVIFICCSFLVAEVLMVKAFGLGIAVAIFMDAFLIRTILVPSTMSLLKSWNWYLPQWLGKILPKW